MSLVNEDQYHIEHFLEMMAAEASAALNTIEAYERDLNEAREFLFIKNIKLINATEIDIKDFLVNLSRKKQGISTQARKLSSLKSFYQFLLSEQIISDHPCYLIESPKKEKFVPKAISNEDMYKLIQTAKNDESYEGIRMLALLELLYATGMRVTELVTLKVKDFQLTEDKSEIKKNFIIINGKGNKERLLPIHEKALISINEYLKLRAEKLKKIKKESEWLFPSTSRFGYLTRQRFGQLLKDLVIKAGLNRNLISPHVIRHSFASHLLNNGADLRSIQLLLGHSDISSTQIYTKILDDKAKQDVFSKHPLMG